MKRESRFTERLALNLTKDRFEAVKATSKRYQITPVELLRQALEIGWPQLEKRLREKRIELHKPITGKLSLHLSEDMLEEVKATSERYQIAPFELMRQALEIGWPRLEKRLQKKRMELHEPTTEKPVFNALGLNLTKDMNDAVKSASERYRILKSGLMRDALEIGWPQLEERLRNKGIEVHEAMQRASRFTGRLALNLGEDMIVAVKATSERYQIALAVLMRQALEIGWPQLEKRLREKGEEI